MGKALIIENLENALYKVQLLMNKESLQALVDGLDSKITILEERIADTPEGPLKKELRLRLTSLYLTRKEYKRYLDAPDPEHTIYCADFSDELTGEVGTIEIVGDKNKGLQIQPGYNGEAIFDSERDGQSAYPTGLTAACNYFNYAILTGWQKWMYRYRYATITELDGNICDVTVEECTNLGFDLNPKKSFVNVPIEYMNVHGESFKEGDEVLLQVDDWDTPKVVGFKKPRRPVSWIVLKIVLSGKTDYVLVWDSAEDMVSTTIPKNGFEEHGEYAVFPCQLSLITDWISGTKNIGQALWNTTEKGFDGTWEDFECQPPMNQACTKITEHDNDCRGLEGELLKDSINYWKTRVLLQGGVRYDETIRHIEDIKAYLPASEEKYNFNSVEMKRDGDFKSSTLIQLDRIYLRYYTITYVYAWWIVLDRRNYTIKTPIGDFEQIETVSKIWDSDVRTEVREKIYFDSLFADLMGKYSRMFFCQIYWMQYVLAEIIDDGEPTKADRVMSVMAQTKIVDEGETFPEDLPALKNDIGRNATLEIAITNLANEWYEQNGYGIKDTVNCKLSCELLV